MFSDCFVVFLALFDIWGIACWPICLLDKSAFSCYRWLHLFIVASAVIAMEIIVPDFLPLGRLWLFAIWPLFKDIAHLSTFKIFIFEKFSCFIVLVVFLVIAQSPELVSVWFCEKMTFFPNFFSNHIFAIYVGEASLGLPTACRLIAVSGARLPSVDGLVVRCIKMHHHVKSAITIC